LFLDGLANVGLQADNEIFALVQEIHLKNGPTVSAFGIGDGFSEVTMRGIAEHGAGHYFYINQPQQIPKYVGKALDNLQSVIGTESVLKLRGKNGCIIKKLFDHDDLLGGAKLKDHKESNMRHLIALAQLTPNGTADSDEVVTYELSYTLPQNQQTHKISGSLRMKFTDDEKALQQTNNEVLVALRSVEAGELDKAVLRMIDEGRTQEAIIQKSIAVEMLKEVVKMDTTGFVEILLARAEKHLADLKADKDPQLVRKALDYDGYLGRRLSICAMSEMKIADG